MYKPVPSSCAASGGVSYVSDIYVQSTSKFTIEVYVDPSRVDLQTQTIDTTCFSTNNWGSQIFATNADDIGYPVVQVTCKNGGNTCTNVAYRVTHGCKYPTPAPTRQLRDTYTEYTRTTVTTTTTYTGAGGAIVGLVIGGICLLVCALSIYCCIIKPRKQRLKKSLADSQQPDGIKTPTLETVTNITSSRANHDGKRSKLCCIMKPRKQRQKKSLPDSQQPVGLENPKLKTVKSISIGRAGHDGGMPTVL
jgi:hypothetical protein